MDIACRIHRVPGDWGESERRVEINVAGRAHRIHHVFDGGDGRFEIDPKRERDPRLAEPDVVGRGFERQCRRHAVAENFLHRARARQPQVIRD